MNRFTKLAGTVALVLPSVAAAGFAHAGGLADPVIAPAPAPAPMVAEVPAPRGTDWTGAYAGGQIGFGRLQADPLDEPDGLTYGLHAGYLYDLGNWVVGGEVDLDATNIEDEAADVALDTVARGKLRVGYDAGLWMPYLTAGIAQATTSGAVAGSDTGGFGGIGLDYALGDGLRIGAELLQHQFTDFDGNGFDIDATTAALRVSFTF